MASLNESVASKSIPWWGWVSIGVLVTLVVNFFSATHKGPVFERVSGANAYLTQIKTVGESMGARARVENGLSATDREKGRSLYLAMKMESDGLVAWLQTGLARRFNAKNDASEYEERLRKMDSAVNAFVEWANKTLPRVFTAAGASPELLNELAEKLITGARETDEKMIDRLRSDLEKCRLQEWEKLTP